MADHQRDLGSLYSWWRGDELPALPDIPGLRVHRLDDVTNPPRLFDLNPARWRLRIQQGHLPYMATLEGDPAAYGWVATREAEIGELDIHIVLGPREYYLWDFWTVPQYRGRRIYPQLLQAIISDLLPSGDAFWIGHGPGNDASRSGIERAGFREVLWIVDTPNGVFAIPIDRERSARASQLLGIPILP